MDLRRLRAGEWMLTVSGLALIVSLFLDWRTGQSGWQAFTVADIVLAACALFALFCVATVATQPTVAVSISAESLCVPLGFAAVVLALVKALGDDAAAGAYVGLAASLGVFAASLIAIRDDSMPERSPEIEPLPPPEGSA